MTVPATVSLTDPFEVDTLLEIRTSAMKKMAGLNVQSGIDKKLCPGPMKVGKLGLEGDEHDPTFHGGPDKAILGYCSSHYAGWQRSYPERRDRFVPGGFGENFVTARMNERNVCIGDVVSVGPELVLQVSLPRQPCFKLNHRFSLKNFAPLTYQTSRTGWYYRVVREGVVRAGDQIRLVERPWPQWTVERVQEYLHRVTDDLDMNRQLAAVDALGEESRGQFRKRVAKAMRKAARAAAAAAGEDDDTWRDFRITARSMETSRVVSLMLEAVVPDPDPELLPLPGSHARIKLPNGLVRSYSLVAGGDSLSKVSDRFELGVALDAHSRGGSRYLHEKARVGDVVQVGRITAGMGFAKAASNHCFVAGGIGITAFLALIRRVDKIHLNYKLHYAVRSADEMPYRDRLEPYRHNIVIYDKSRGERMDVAQIVKGLMWNSHLYVCGPNRMMEAAKAAVEEAGISPGEVHYEAFAADISGDPFEVEVTGSKKSQVLAVGEDESLLEVLRREMPDFPSSCEVGNCGTCKITVRSGRVDHRGSALLPEEQETSMLACVSRGIGRIAIEV
ncbi:hypothetical protein JDV02_002252 [Purpureocillium takamizusanense]|uniref:Uncharacterized protein n=1 Tax=Purpureocillium takamizusanense TaxID=2060973 RepID=A0A9Q8QAM2_9HYPO|nr:uncharacterized protein JDV02_002252 [Purpureocillium takamizusanense]UNI15746.1 hypothetical protein JDV02_002252 [Purpureocillium takamizusanense]